MKTRKIVWMILLPWILLANPFAPNRANIWIEDGGQSRSFSINGWSQDVHVTGNMIEVMGKDVTKFSTVGPLRVLVNNTPKSLPNMRTSLPRLSLVGLDAATDVYMDDIVLDISPNGGTFDHTVAVTFTLNAPAGTTETVKYRIDNGTIVERGVSIDTNASFTIYLAANGDHNVSYMYTSEPSFKIAEFHIDAGSTKRDSDGDGIPDMVEAEIGLDPFDNVVPDSDKDGWNDWEEYLRDTDSDSNDSIPLDTDGDGWSDWDEDLRGTNIIDPRNCANKASKPAADALYGIEYKIMPSKDINFSVGRVSFVDIQSQRHYDTITLAKTHPSKASQPQLCSTDYTKGTTYASDYNETFNEIFIDNLHEHVLGVARIPATIPAIERLRAHNHDKDEVTPTVYKNWLEGRAPLSLQSFLSSDGFLSLKESYSVSDFTEAYVDYLRENLVVERDYSASMEESIAVAWLEAAMRSRIQSNATLIVGHPDFPAPADAFIYTRDALSGVGKNFNDLHTDIVAYMSSDILSDVEAEWQRDDGNLTEQRIANYIQNNAKLHNDRYIVSLMTVAPYVMPGNTLGLLKGDEDSDSDGIKNSIEIAGVDYTLPNDEDSDHDGTPDGKDLCPNDANDGCINDTLSTQDSDEDGIVDAIDNCPLVENPDQESTMIAGVGDICAKNGIVIVSPKSNIKLFQGESYHFEAKTTEAGTSGVVWTVNGEIAAKETLTLTVLFDKASLEERVCVQKDKKNESCIHVTVLERKNYRTVSVYAAPTREGDTGNSMLWVELYLTHPAATRTVYQYQTKDGTAIGRADYLPIHGEVVFEAGENRQYLGIPIIGDTDFEEDEELTIVVDGSKSDPLVILNDDADIPDPVLSVTLLDTDGSLLEDMHVLESDVDRNITMQLTLSSPARKNGTTLHYDLGPVMVEPVPEGTIVYPEYHSMIGVFAEGTIDFAIGEQSKEINITILGDTISESNASFAIRLSDAVNMHLRSTPNNAEDIRDILITILDNDPLPHLTFEQLNYEVQEGDRASIKLLLSEKSYQTIEVNLTIGSESTATEGEDYTLSTLHAVILATAPSATIDTLSTVIEMNTTEGLDGEGDETLVLHASSARNASLDSGISTTVTIKEASTPSPIDGQAFVRMQDATHGAELWRSDGTAAGTALFGDLAVDANSSNPRLMTRVGDLLYFVAQDEAYHEKLFVTDGTEAGTVALTSFSNEYIASLTSVEGELYFVVSNTANNLLELWKSEGTTASTAKLLDIYHGYEWKPEQMVALGGLLCFPSNVSSEEFDIELYAYDTASNALAKVKEIKEGTEGSNIMYLTKVEDLFYFVANSNEIWKSDGTEANTVQVYKDLNDTYINKLVYFNNTVYFTRGAASGSVIKGLNTASGIVSDIASYTDDSISMLTATTDSVYYSTAPNASGGAYTLYRISDLSSESVGTLASYASQTYSLGTHLYIQQSDGLYSSSEAGLANIKPLSSNANIDFAEETLGDTLLFRISDYASGTTELWQTNGSAAGTMKLTP